MNKIPTSAPMTAEKPVPIIFVREVNKTYAGDFQVLKEMARFKSG